MAARSAARSWSPRSRSSSASLVGAVLIILSGVIGPAATFDPTLPITAYGALLEGSLGSPKAIANTLNSATPLIFAGLSVAFGFRAGLFNIGANGQLLVGAFCARWSARSRACPVPIAIVAALFAGAIGGAAWGFIPGALKAWRGAHEVVTTIMLNSTAYLLLNLLASTTFKDPGATFPRTPDIQPAAVLGIIVADTRLHGGIIIGVLTAIADLVPAVQDRARLRDPDRRRERQRRALRRHPAGLHHRS